MSASNRWSLVLAAGAGTRLSSLTMRAGASVPKQFCALVDGASLLDETLERAAAVVGAERTLVVVAAEHRKFWQNALGAVPSRNVIVQPQNRGTALGILLGLAAIRERDPSAAVVILPSDHFIENEPVLRRSIARALAALDTDACAIAFLGIQPECADPELGYIVRGQAEADGSYRIAEFVEKPDPEHARALLERSALWNSFIIVAAARALLDLIGARYADETEHMTAALRHANPEDALQRAYARFPVIDFSRDVVEGAAARLKVVPVTACGWSDLGTPRRVAECLDRLGSRASVPRRADGVYLSLAAACQRNTGASALGIA